MNKLTTILLGAAMLCGCQSNKEPTACQDECLDKPGDNDLAFFSEDRDQPTALSKILDAQTARGAAADAMLRPAHFNGTALNALGTDKLDAIVRGTATGQPVVIYLDLPTQADTDADAPANERGDAHHEAVMTYLESQGLLSEQVSIHAGDNPGVRHLASLTSPKRYKVEERAIGSAEVANDAATTPTPAAAAGLPMSPAQ